MGLDYFNEKLLLRRLKSNENGTFLFGSAISAIKDGVGIPNVSQVAEIIEDYAKELDLFDDFKEHINSFNEQEKYQESFSFFSAIMGAASTREIIKRVVMRNYDIETGKHGIPKAIQDFVRSVKEKKIKVKNIITTNFDTLIEEQFKNEGIDYNSISIVSDSNILNNSNGFINIIHLHGVWNEGDTMHTKNQLESKRDKIEASLRNFLAEQHVVVMAYSGWVDSFTRTLANIVNDDKAEYNLAWCFYQAESGVIDRNAKGLIESLTPAINRDRIQFFKGIDCNNVFANLLSEVDSKKKESKKLEKKKHDEVNYYLIEEKGFYKKIREKARQKSISILNKNKALFLEAVLGSGVYGFISSVISTVQDKKIRCLKVDLSDVISKNQIDDKVRSDTGHYLNSLIFLLSLDKDTVHFIIFDKIRGNADEETLLYLLNLPKTVKGISENIFFIYSSSVNKKQFKKIRVQLNEITLHETGIILRDEFEESRLSLIEINQIHEKSEGVLAKLEQLMFFLESSSAHEVINQDDIFDDIFHSESIPSTTLKQIDLLINDPSKSLTLNILKILSILKNGETLSNLRKDKMGVKLSPRNTKELIQLELATTIYIDKATTIIRINPIIKDYVLSKMSLEEQYEIANAYLKVSVKETKSGIKLSSINRKIYDSGYNTEEDNTNTILRLSIQECKNNVEKTDLSEDNLEMNRRKLNKLLYISRVYVYLLCDSSRFYEAISAIDNLIEVVAEVDSENIYKYYYHIAYAHRMKSNTEEAQIYLDKCEELCPESDKSTLEFIYMDKLYLLETKNKQDAINFSKQNKSNFHNKSAAYIASDVMIAHSKDSGERVKALERQEKKARKLGYYTLANNILFTLSDERNDVEKLDLLDKVISSDNSAYNNCRATIYKHEVLVRTGNFAKIKDSDVEKLLNIYNYLFRQKFDYLFNKCHSILWSIAESRKNKDLIILIFYQSTIVWKLNSDEESEQKYNTLYSNLDSTQNMSHHSKTSLKLGVN